MSEAEEEAKLLAFMEDFKEGNEARVAELRVVEQEVALLTDQINTKADHLRQLSEQRNGLIVKCQSIRNDAQDASMTFLADYIEIMVSDN